MGWLLFQVVPHCDRDQVVAHSNVPSNSLSKKLIYTRNHVALSGNPKISFFDRNTNFIKDEQTFEEDNSEIFKTLRPLINHLFPPFIAPIHGIVVSLGHTNRRSNELCQFSSSRVTTCVVWIQEIQVLRSISFFKFTVIAYRWLNLGRCSALKSLILCTDELGLFSVEKRDYWLVCLPRDSLRDLFHYLLDEPCQY